jgi:hypothetical protein
MAVRYCDKTYGKALPHNISRHTGPKAQSETDKPTSPPPPPVLNSFVVTNDRQ